VRWQSVPGLAHATVAVNLSSHQVIRDEFSDEVEMALADSGLDPRLLVLEMTETAMFRDMQGAVQKLQSLRTKGIRLAVDDFGTGYSSLRYLREFHIDELKIAREFIASEDETEDAWALAHAMVMLGRTLGLTIVAEGVETDRQRRRLLDLGCHVGQGFLFSRAVRIDAVASVAARLHGHDPVQTLARRRDASSVDRARGAVTA
jgi:EAL domain-containing protein (putative c-di-GMP-specific phosphodiesterase class I)